MPARGEKIRALLATGRIANLPTVCSNVLAGFWLSSSLYPACCLGSISQDKMIVPLLFLMLSCCMIYVAGCMLGDAVDLAFDRKNRPSRPIPQGILTARSVRSASYVLFALALIILFFVTPVTALLNEYQAKFLSVRWTEAIQTHEIVFGLLLSGVVTCYAFHHKKNKPAALIMMGSCRFLLVILAMSFAHKTFLQIDPAAAAWPGPHPHWLASWMLIPALGVGAYTILLSWVASTESRPGAFQSRNILTFLLLTVPASSLAIIFLMPITEPLQYISYAVALILCYLWMCYGLKALKTSKPVFVSRALAGFCLLDATFLAPIEPMAAAVCLMLFVIALTLQRVAPAT